MRKNIFYLFVFFLCSSSLCADTDVENLKKEILFFVPTLHGWCSKEKAANFIDLVVKVKPKICVEIGVFGGASVYPVVSALKFLNNGIIYAIDPWDKIECIKYYDPVEDQANLDWWGKVNLPFIYGAFVMMLKGHELENYCTIMKTPSETAVESFAPSSIDILYIDGNHCEPASTQDVLLYLPKVRSGGYIWMNDALWATTQEAVGLLLDSCNVVKTIDNGNCILFKKN